MSRRRHKLEVSTFPFLAVLLCAMGSLILLLLVIDRRARAVATAKAARAAAESVRLAEEHDSAKIEARRAEMERRKRALHALLLQQDQSLRDQITKVKSSADTTSREAEDKRARMKALQERLAAEAARLEAKRAQLDAKRKLVVQTEQMSAENRKELARMSAGWPSSKTRWPPSSCSRQRDTQLFSVVPYHGKRQPQADLSRMRHDRAHLSSRSPDSQQHVPGADPRRGRKTHRPPWHGPRGGRQTKEERLPADAGSSGRDRDVLRGAERPARRGY